MMNLALIVLSVAVLPSFALDNGLARTPQMGYNSWYDWTCNMDEKQLMDTIDAFVANGFPELGYNYFNLDDCWAKNRSSNGTLIADTAHFPSGTLKPLADYAHSKGLKFGTYTDRGPKTCAGRPAAEGYEFQDAQTYADWGVDYLKEDSCNAPQDHDTAFGQYGKMRDGLNKTGRPILFSLCGWNAWYAPPGQSLGNSWRIGPDDTNWHGVLSNININSQLAQYAGPGGWNDPCLLLAETWQGSLRQTQLQTRAQFSMWAIMASPLLISANVRNMSVMNMETYKNIEVISVSQDPLGMQGTRLVGVDLTDGAPANNNKAAHVAPCSGSATPEDIWMIGDPKDGYIKNKGNGLCLNVDDCKSDIIYYDCVTTGGSCSTGLSNMRFNLTGGVLVSAMNGQCATVENNNLFLTACPKTIPPANQAFHATPDGLIQNGLGGCLTTSAAPPSPDYQSTNVWGRKLVDGYSMVFINTGSNATDIECDGNCMTAAGFTATDSLVVRDLWAHSNSTATGSGITAKNVSGEGGVWMIKITKSSN